MESARQFQEYAEECLDWAKSARSNQEREIFLQMAQTWMEAAMLASKEPALRERRRLPKSADDNRAGDATVSMTNMLAFE
jgi:hypothetical protein